METKKDKLMEAVLNNLEKWKNANEAKRRHLFIAANGSGIQTMCNCSVLDLIVMFRILTLDSPQFALAMTKVAGLINRLMQSENTYQKLKKDKDLSVIVKDELFMNYFKQAVEKRDGELAEFFAKGYTADLDNDDDNDNDEEQS